MAQATFHSIKTEKSALILVKPNKWVFQQEPVYVPVDAIPEGIEKGETFEIPDGYELVDMVGEDGKPYTTEPNEKGETFNLKVLAY